MGRVCGVDAEFISAPELNVIVVVFHARTSGAPVQHDMPGDRDGRPDECNGTKDIKSVQNQHRGQHNKEAVFLHV